MDAMGKLTTASLKPQTDEQVSAKKARETAQQFEATLVRQLVGSLRSTSKIGGDEGGMFGSEPGSDTYADWFDEHVANDISEHGKIGVADALIAEFDRHKRGRVDKKAAANEQSLDQIDHKQLAAPGMPTQLHGREGGDHAAR
jgi:Rod binding domain-containing protein